MKRKEWKQVTPTVWVCDEWAVEDCNGYASLFRDGVHVWDYKTVKQAMGGATQTTLDRAAASLQEYRQKPLGLAKLKC